MELLHKVKWSISTNSLPLVCMYLIHVKLEDKWETFSLQGCTESELCKIGDYQTHTHKASFLGTKQNILQKIQEVFSNLSKKQIQPQQNSYVFSLKAQVRV